MSEHFDKLKNIGAQKIHENTHISRLHIESILQEDFTAMTKIQLLGFISILEREYSLDLDILKNSAIRYFEDLKAKQDEEDLEVKVFLAPKRRRNLTPIYIIVVFIIFVSIMFMSMSNDTNEIDEAIIDDSAIENATNYIEPTMEVVTELPVTQEENITTPLVENVKANVDEKEENTSFKIIPKVKVWLGYVDLKTHEKHQKTFENEFDLDASKDWLLAFGHGHIHIEINGVIKKYKIKKNVRFSYINGELKEISLEEFKRLNKGDRW